MIPIAVARDWKAAPKSAIWSLKAPALWIWMVAGWILLLSAPPAAADQPVALVYEVAGANDAKLLRYSEIFPGQIIELPASGRLSFVHYVSCRATMVGGGTIKFTPLAYVASGGQIESEVQQVCPRVVTILEKGVVGGAGVMRGGGMNVPVRPDLLLIGRRADSVAAVSILDGDHVIAEASVIDHRPAWANGVPLLTSGTPYRLLLNRSVAGAVELPLRATGDANSTLFLLRID